MYSQAITKITATILTCAVFADDLVLLHVIVVGNLCFRYIHIWKLKRAWNWTSIETIVLFISFYSSDVNSCKKLWLNQKDRKASQKISNPRNELEFFSEMLTTKSAFWLWGFWVFLTLWCILRKKLPLERLRQFL